MPNITQITPPRVPIIDPRTGAITREWYRYFYNLYYATGGENGGATPTDRGGTGLTSFTPDGVMYASDEKTLATGPDFTFDGTDVHTTGSVTADINVNAGIDVNAGNNVNAEVDVNAGNNVNAGVDVNAGNDVNAGVDVNAGNDVNAVRDVNAGRNVNVVGYVASPTYIDFNTTKASPAYKAGRLYWDIADGNKTLSLCMNEGSVIQQIGEEIYYRVKASAAITEGQVVMFTGTVGASGVVTAAPATGLTADTASYVMGIATANIDKDAFGYITQFGLVRGINTTGGAESWVDGQILYLNPSVAGGLTKTVPTAPNPKVQVCAVVNAGPAGSGSLFVRPTYGGKLGQFEGDVQITSPAAGQLLMHKGTKWVNITSTPSDGQLLRYNGTTTEWESIAGANGELLIGNGTGFTKATLTAGANITITNGAGSITIAAASVTGASGSFTTADGKTVTVTNGVVTSIV